jgi:hypothetical protein
MRELVVTKTVDGTWVSYSGTARIDLAIVLVAVAAGMVYAGTRLRQPVRLPRPGETATGIMVMAWVLAIVAFLACATQYVSAMRQHHLLHRLPPHPITPVTDACAVVIFVTILIMARSHGWPVRLASAAVGAMAAPMVFEFPFDLIVMARTYPPIPPDPVMYRVLFFAPLFLVEFATLSFLTFAPMVRLTRATVFSFALMLAVFAAWALSGFAFPATPGPFAFNVLSKILAFTTALTLFLPQRSEASTSPPAMPTPLSAIWSPAPSATQGSPTSPTPAATTAATTSASSPLYGYT